MLCYNDTGHSNICCKEACPAYTTYSSSSKPSLAPCYEIQTVGCPLFLSENTSQHPRHNPPGLESRSQQGVSDSVYSTESSKFCVSHFLFLSSALYRPAHPAVFFIFLSSSLVTSLTPCSFLSTILMYNYMHSSCIRDSAALEENEVWM